MVRFLRLNLSEKNKYLQGGILIVRFFASLQEKEQKNLDFLTVVT